MTKLVQLLLPCDCCASLALRCWTPRGGHTRPQRLRDFVSSSQSVLLAPPLHHRVLLLPFLTCCPSHTHPLSFLGCRLFPTFSLTHIHTHTPLQISASQLLFHLLHFHPIITSTSLLFFCFRLISQFCSLFFACLVPLTPQLHPYFPRVSSFTLFSRASAPSHHPPQCPPLFAVGAAFPPSLRLHLLSLSLCASLRCLPPVLPSAHSHLPSHPTTTPRTFPRAVLLASLTLAALLAAVPRLPSSLPASAVPADMAATAAAAAAAAGAPTKVVREVFALGRTPFKTFDPFLFCVYHNDAYPASTKDSLGPDAKLLKWRDIGSDFSYEDGWSMYHGSTVPGFPAHPHRGFETITVTRTGLVDHSDSVKCTARYGEGDTQWLTAGGGIQHTEMFPLVHADRANPLQLFQVWLNLPRKSKMCAPYFSMFWKEETPVAELATVPLRAGGAAPAGRGVAKVVAGELDGVTPLAPPPDSWAAARDADVAVWTVDIPANAAVTLPAARGGAATTRAVYFVKGGRLEVGAGEAVVDAMSGARVAAEVPLVLGAVGEAAEVLVLQGRPIGEPVVQHGPFVMNTREEIMQCFADYRRTEFGGWPWESSDHVHPRDTPRHAVHMGGRKEFPPNKPDTTAPSKPQPQQQPGKPQEPDAKK